MLLTDTDRMAEERNLTMSNLDHTIDDGLEAALKAAPSAIYCRHAAWNFNGRVWWDGQMFVEQVWVYGSPRAEIRAATLQELMDEVNSEYGYE